jgi:hypothetical protein
MAVCDPSLPTDISTLRVKLATVPTLSQSVAVRAGVVCAFVVFCC